MYSPNGENWTGVAGISAGSEGVAIHGRDTLKIQAVKRVSMCIILYFTRVYNYCIPVSDCVFECSGDFCTGMRLLDGAWEVSGRTVSFVGVAPAVHLYITFMYMYLKTAICKD